MSTERAVTYDSLQLTSTFQVAMPVSWKHGEDGRQPMNLGKMLRHSAGRTPQKPAIICGDQIVSYEALDRSTDALAGWLLREGLRTRRPGGHPLVQFCRGGESLFRLLQSGADCGAGQQSAEGPRDRIYSGTLQGQAVFQPARIGAALRASTRGLSGSAAHLHHASPAGNHRIGERQVARSHSRSGSGDFVHIGHHGAAQRSDAYTRFAHRCQRTDVLAGPGRNPHPAGAQRRWCISRRSVACSCREYPTAERSFYFLLSMPLMSWT